MKKKVTMTLNAEEVALIERAKATLCPSDKHVLVYSGKSWESWIANIAICRFAAAIIRQGGMDLPVAVDIRHETPEERAERRRVGPPLDPRWDRGGWFVE